MHFLEVIHTERVFLQTFLTFVLTSYIFCSIIMPQSR